MAREQLSVDRAKDRNCARLIGEGQIEGQEAAVLRDRGRAPALAVPGMAQNRRQPRGQRIDGDAGDDLVAALRDGGVAMHEAEQDRRRDAGGQPHRRAARGERGRGGGEGGRQHLSLQPDVDDPGALRPKPREAGADQRRRQPDRRGEHLEDGVEGLHQAGLSRVSPPSSAATGRLKAYSSAPAKRITKPWITTIMSRVMAGLSKESSVPPW